LKVGNSNDGKIVEVLLAENEKIVGLRQS